MATALPSAPLELADIAKQPLERMRPQRGLWNLAWRRLRKNKMAMIAMVYLVCLFFVAVFAEQIAPHNPVKSDVKTAGQLRKAAWIEDPNPMKTGTWDYP